MGKRSRDKGKRGEREAAAMIAHHWNATGARRAVQFCGRSGDADLTGVPGLHCEVKRYARISALDFLQQAEMDASPDTVPVVLMREDTSTEWVVMLRVSDAPEFARRLLQMVGEPGPITNPDAYAGGLE
jgi:hypothetical protein